jgi:hypothetical protein
MEEEKNKRLTEQCAANDQGSLKVGKAGEEKPLWYFRPWVIAGAILTVGPLGLPLLWFRPKTGLRLKIGISVVVIGLTVWMSITTADYYQEMVMHYEKLANALENM